MGVCDQKKNSGFEFNSTELTPKIELKYMDIREMPSDRGNPSTCIHVIIRGSASAMVNIWWLPFSRTPCPRVMQIGTLGDKTHTDSKCDNQPALIAIPDHKHSEETIIYMLTLTMLVCNFMYRRISYVM